MPQDAIDTKDTVQDGEGHLHVKKDGDVLGGHPEPRTPGGDTECTRRSVEMFWGAPGIKDTKRWLEMEGGAVHVKEGTWCQSHQERV